MSIIVWLLAYLYYRLYRFKFLHLIGLVFVYEVCFFVFMSFSPDLFIVSFGELDIPPVIFALMIFLTLFIFLAVLISTSKLIQSLVNESD